MNHFTTQRQRIFVVDKQETEPISNVNIRARREIAHAQAADADIAGFAQPYGFSMALVFNGQS
jgi:hypothetical protein